MEDSKVWWKSKTIWSAVITSASLLSYAFGVGPMLSGTDIASTVELVLGAVGALATVISRFTATQQLTVKSPSE